MYKIIISVSLTIIAVPMIVGAAYNDVSLTTDAVITVGSYSLSVNGSTAVVESIVVSATDFTVTMPAGSSIAVQSTGKYIMETRGVANGYTSQECSASSNTLTITIPSSQATETAVITPTATVCSVATSAESGRRSSGGGSRAVSVPTPTVTTLTNNTVSNLTVLVSTPFTRRLVKSVSGNDVKNLQIVLNSDKDTKIALEGSGSPGNETNFFGSLTLKAVQKFQVKYSIAKDGDEGYGQVGPKTRAKLNELSGKR